MADEYETPPEEAADTEPESPAEDAPEGAGEQAKISQEEANYREGNPQRSCGLCGHFDSKGHSCDVVEGTISPYGFSKLYMRQDNPFREGEKEGFKGGTKIAVVAPVAPASPPAGLLTIGRKTYGGAA
jgi:hypothetical protein